MSEDEKISVLYEDDFVKLMWRPGDSDYLLITFGDAVTLVNGVHFFARQVVEKQNIACLGFMAKEPNWFPADSMSQAIKSAHDILGEHPVRIAYGGSMGGYAAVKFSKLLGTADTIAFCPQWSIDPAECGGFELGYRHSYRPYMRGMGITCDDVGGNIVLFYDKKFKEDEFHRIKLEEVCENVTTINTHYSDHHITTIFAGTDNLVRLIKAIRGRDVSRIEAESNLIRRKSPSRGETVLLRSIYKHPKLCYYAHLRLRNRVSKLGVTFTVFIPFFIKHFAEVGDHEKAFECVKYLVQHSQNHDQVMWASFLFEVLGDKNRPNGKYLKAYSGSFLVFNALSSRLMHVHADEILNNERILHRIKIVIFEGRAKLYVETNERCFGLALDKDGGCKIAQGVFDPSTSTIMIGRVDTNEKNISMRFDDVFISAEPDSTITINRSAPFDCETFELIES